MPRSCLFAALIVIAAPVVAQEKVAPPPAPAIGYDWNDGSTADDRIAQTMWPRADAAAAGVDDMIFEDAKVRASLHADESFGGRTLRTLRKVGGDYMVVPVLKIHLGHPRQE